VQNGNDGLWAVPTANYEKWKNGKMEKWNPQRENFGPKFQTVPLT
jgi:hypothetical protein